jgi:hypothetical protein
MIDNVKAFALAISAGMAISPWASFVLAALWLLPEWVKQWLVVVKHGLDVRDRWHP